MIVTLVQNNFWSYIFWRPAKRPRFATATQFFREAEVNLKNKYVLYLKIVFIYIKCKHLPISSIQQIPRYNFLVSSPDK